MTRFTRSHLSTVFAALGCAPFASAGGDSPPLSPAPLSVADSGAINFSYGNFKDETPPAASDSAKLAEKLSNPVADLISVPFQLNYDEGFGQDDAGKWTLNIQPVIPFSISEDWNLITRTIVPVIYRESPGPGEDDEFGLGDITQSFFFSPKEGSVIWGVGPAILWPAATSDELGTRQWGLGPTFVILKQEHGWTYGILANHIWSIAGENDHEDVNATFLQPFVSYTWHTATSLTLNTESTYDWSSGEWTIPLNLMVSQVVKIGNQPVSFQVGGRYYADSPDDGPEWGLRFNITLLFPK